MSAKIIQFGKLAALSRRPYRRRAIKQHVDKTSVRFVFEEELLEAEFYGANVNRVHAIQYRISASGVQEMRRERVGGYRGDDPVIVAAAYRARESGTGASDAPFRATAIAALRKRHANLLRIAAKVEATIASMQAGLD